MLVMSDFGGADCVICGTCMVAAGMGKWEGEGRGGGVMLGRKVRLPEEAGG